MGSPPPFRAPRRGPGAARFPPRLSKPLISPHLAVAARPRRGGQGHCAQECLSVPPARPRARQLRRQQCATAGTSQPRAPRVALGTGTRASPRPAGVPLVVGHPPPRHFGVLGLAAWPRGAALVVAGCRCWPARRMASFPSQFWERWPRPYGAGGAQPGRERGCFAPSRGCPAAEHIKAPGRAPPAPAGPHRARPHCGDDGDRGWAAPQPRGSTQPRVQGSATWS